MVFKALSFKNHHLVYEYVYLTQSFGEALFCVPPPDTVGRYLVELSLLGHPDLSDQTGRFPHRLQMSDQKVFILAGKWVGLPLKLAAKYYASALYFYLGYLFLYIFSCTSLCYFF